MAIMKLQSKMVYWRIYHGENLTDITHIIGPYVSSIKVKKTSLPLKLNSKSKHSPSEAMISVTSPNYIEDIFIEGVAIKITMGYDPLNQPTVFTGKIKSLPEGSAKDMLNYTVQAFGVAIDMADEEKNRTFKMPFKEIIIHQIAIEAGYVPNISIADNSPMQAQFVPIQKQETDLQFVMRCAKSWNCICWFTEPRTINFADADIAYDLADGTIGKTDTYLLGYRTDKVPCNVETVSWKHKPPVAVSAINAGITGFNEFGKTTSGDEFKIANYDNKTWRLKARYRNLIKNGAKQGGFALAKEVSRISMGLTLGLNSSAENYNKFKKYFEVIKYNDNTGINQYPPAGDNSGFEISVHLNEGDPLLNPPRNALLYSGVLNPKVDTAALPLWLNRNGLGEFAKLKINETVLSYENGMLKSELLCTMGRFGE